MILSKILLNCNLTSKKLFINKIKNIVYFFYHKIAKITIN